MEKQKEELCLIIRMARRSWQGWFY